MILPTYGRVEADHDILNLSTISIDRNALDRTIHCDLSDDDALVGHETSLAYRRKAVAGDVEAMKASLQARARQRD
jgi:hypothetical protein